jgi:menaquinone-9 beta-reductase
MVSVPPVPPTPALIIGGGPAGAAAAITLARGGRDVLVIERSTGPRNVVCGGFLGGDALRLLDRLGVNAEGLGARPIERLRLVADGRVAEAPLPWRAAGLSRRTLDEALLAKAESEGAEVRRGTKATEVSDRTVMLADGTGISADALLLATGKHELRGVERLPPEARRRLSIGLRCAISAPADLTGVIELHPFNGGYAGLLVMDDGRANLCLSATQQRLHETGGSQALLARLSEEQPALGARIALADADAWSAIAGVPYGWRARSTSVGLLRLGDQAAVIASLAGDGVAIALSSGMAAGQALLAGREEAYQPRFARQAAGPLRTADALRYAAERQPGRKALLGLMRAFPAAAGLVARLTRIED